MISVSDEKALLFEGKPVQPAVTGNNGLVIPALFTDGDADVVLVEDIGGTACPALFHFVRISKQGLNVSESFGSCSDLIEIVQTQKFIQVSMPSSQNERHVFKYQAGELTIRKFAQ